MPGEKRRLDDGRIIGIDLGTTNSCAAVAEGASARVLVSRLGAATIPSVIAEAPGGKLLVGQAAKAQMLLSPRSAVYGSKRLVGRPFASPTVQACRDRFTYEIVAGADGDAAVRLGGRVLSLQQISAMILREMREFAAAALGEEVTRAVVTVPAYYNDHQRNAVREAGELAGLRVERIVNEPTAAAVAFGFGKGLDRRVLVYDLGGGTFDASIVEIENDVYEVVSTGGDTFLGGVDFDNQMVNFLVLAFTQEHGFAPPGDDTARQRVREAAEEAKIALSARESVEVHVRQLCAAPDGRPLDLRVTVTRPDLEDLTRHLVDRSLDVCHDVLRAKGLTRDDIDDVLLVGGQSRMPLVWRRIREEFGREPSHAVHPDEAVALGAALLADADQRIDSVVLLDALAMGIGVALPGGRMVPVLPRNIRLPARRSHELSAGDGQGPIEVVLVQGDAPQVAECEYLGTVRIERPRRAGRARVALELAVGNEGILSVGARDLETGGELPAHMSTGDTPESLTRKLGLADAPVAPPGARPIEAARGMRDGSGRRPERGAAERGPAAPGRPPAATVTPPPAQAGPAQVRNAPSRERKGLLARLFRK
jgi:molecular chaperone DnaK